MTDELDRKSNQEADRCAPIIWRLRLIYNERPRKITPTISRAIRCIV